MERHVGIARGRPHVARGWREWRQRSRDGGALLPRRRRLRTSRGRIARRYYRQDSAFLPIPVVNEHHHQMTELNPFCFLDY